MLNDMISLTERSEVREIGTGLLNDMISLAERSEVREIGTGTLNERSEFSSIVAAASLVAS